MDKVKIKIKHAFSENAQLLEMYLGKDIMENNQEKIIDVFKTMFPDHFINLSWFNIEDIESVKRVTCIPKSMEIDERFMSDDAYEQKWGRSK